jgi:uncharacterized protein (TIGR02001 family)
MKRKMMKWCIAFAAVAILTGQTMVHADEADKPTASVDVGIFSQYIWRGLELSKDSVVIQPSVTVGYKGISLNVWGNLDTNNDNYSGNKYNETDLTLSYSKDVGITTLTGGYIYYGLDGVKDSQEVFATVGLNTILSPTITVYREIAVAPAWYINVGVSHSVNITEKITLDLAASAGYYYSDSNNFTEANSTSKYRELHNGLVSAGFTIPVGEYFTVKPMLAYSFALTNKAKDYIKANSLSDKSNFLYGGVTASMAF